MSGARAVLTLAAAVVVLPIVLRARANGAARGVAVVSETQPGRESRATPADLRAFLEGVRGANAIQCEIILQSFNAWSSSRSPDRDSAAYAITTVIRHGDLPAESVTDLVAALRSGDDCASRSAARLLGRSGIPAGRLQLLAALRDPDARVRELGAVGLGFSNDSTMSALLVRLLADNDARVRAAAAWAIGAVH